MVLSVKTFSWVALAAGMSCWSGFVSAGTFSTYHVGNSLTGDLTTGLKYSVSAHETPTNTYKWGVHFRASTSLTFMNNVRNDLDTKSITGTNTSSSWQENIGDPADGGWHTVPWTTSLAASNHWDVVTMEPYPGNDGLGGTANMGSDTTAINTMIATARPHDGNATSRYLIYQAWPSLTNSTDSANFNTIWAGGTVNNSASQASVLKRKYFEYLFESVKSTNSDIGMIPVGEVLYALRQKMQPGGTLYAQGLTDIRQLYRDQWHMNVFGSDIAGYTAYAAIYKTSPVDLASNPSIGTDYSKTITYPDTTQYTFTETVPTAAALQIVQETVWQVVSDQSYYTQVPEPTSAAMIIGGTLVLGSGRRLGRKSGLMRR